MNRIVLRRSPSFTSENSWSSSHAQGGNEPRSPESERVLASDAIRETAESRAPLSPEHGYDPDVVDALLELQAQSASAPLASSAAAPLPLLATTQPSVTGAALRVSMPRLSIVLKDRHLTAVPYQPILVPHQPTHIPSLPAQASSAGDEARSLNLAHNSNPELELFERGSDEAKSEKAKKQLKDLKRASEAFSSDGTTLTDPYRDHLIRLYYYGGDKYGELQARAYELGDRSMPDIKLEASALRSLTHQHIEKLRKFISIVRNDDNTLKNVQTALKRIMRNKCGDVLESLGYLTFYKAACKKGGMHRSEAEALAQALVQCGNGNEVYRSSLRFIEQEWPFTPLSTPEPPVRPEARYLAQPIVVARAMRAAQMRQEELAPEERERSFKHSSELSAFRSYARGAANVSQNRANRRIPLFISAAALVKREYSKNGYRVNNAFFGDPAFRRDMIAESFAKLAYETQVKGLGGKKFAKERSFADFILETYKRRKTSPPSGAEVASGNLGADKRPVVSTLSSRLETLNGFC